MFDKFNAGSRRVINDTYTHVKELNHPSIGTEHLLLSLVENRKSPSAIALAKLGVFPNKVRGAVLAECPRGKEPVREKPLVSAPARLALQAASLEAEAMGSREVGPEHILLGLLRQPNSTAAKILKELGVKPNDLRARVNSLDASEREEDEENKASKAKTKGEKGKVKKRKLLKRPAPAEAEVAVAAEENAEAVETEPEKPAKSKAKDAEASKAKQAGKASAEEDEYYYDDEDDDDEAIDFDDVFGEPKGGKKPQKATLADSFGAEVGVPSNRREWIRSLGAAAIIVAICAVGLGGIYFLGRDTDSHAVTLAPAGDNAGGQVLPTAPTQGGDVTPVKKNPGQDASNPTDPNAGANPADPDGKGKVEGVPKSDNDAAKPIDFGMEGLTEGTPSGTTVGSTRQLDAQRSSKTFSYDLTFDSGLGLKADQLSEGIHKVLNDPRSWAADGYTAFQVPSRGQYHIFILGKDEVNKYCTEAISQGYYSCTIGNAVYINADRWFNGDESFIKRGGTVNDYRIYLLNRQLGLALGMPEAKCAGPGKLSPVMESQTKSDSPCKANGWPYPSNQQEGSNNG